jgi:hypothetical protein
VIFDPPTASRSCNRTQVDDIILYVRRTQISLTEEQLARLRVEALRRNVSLAQVIRDAIDRTVRGGDWEARKLSALAAVGKLGEDRPDVSARHDDYVAETILG